MKTPKMNKARNIFISQRFTMYFTSHVRTQSLSYIWLFATPLIISHHAPLSMEFSKQEYWSGLSFPIPGALPDPGIRPAFPALAGGFFTTAPPGKPL